MKAFTKYSNISQDKEYLTLEEVLNVINQIRDDFNKTAEQSKKYTSFNDYYYETFKHIRKETSPDKVYKTPITYGQNYGFQKFTDKDLNDVKFPIRKCEETKYGEIMARIGKHIMK